MKIDPYGKKILIIKLRYIGDTISILPVIENLKKYAPDSQIDVMVHKGTEEVLKFHPDIRRIWDYDRYSARKSLVSAILYHRKLLKNLRNENYDILIDFTHGDRAAFISFLSGTPIRISYRESSTLSHILMNHFVHSDSQEKHIIDHQLEALKFFGIDTFRREMAIHIPETVEHKVTEMLSNITGHEGQCSIVIHPGARGKLRKWKPERFAKIADRIANKFKYNIILIGGSGEVDSVTQVERNMETPVAFRSTELSLLEIAALFKTSTLLIGNDSAPGHIAAAVNCPSVILFGPTFPHMWRPLIHSGEVIFKNLPCCGCKQIECIRPENNCMDLIQVEEVWGKVEYFLTNLKKPANSIT